MATAAAVIIDGLRQPGAFAAGAAGRFDAAAPTDSHSDTRRLASRPATVAEAFAGRRFGAPVVSFPSTDGSTAIVENAVSINSYTAAGAERLILDLTAHTSRAQKRMDYVECRPVPEV